MSSPGERAASRDGRAQTRPLSKRAQAAAQIDTANKASNEEFVEKYLKPGPDWTTWTHPVTSQLYTLTSRPSEALTPAELDACFAIIDTTSGAAYRASSVGWHPVTKREEMLSAGLRYLLVKDPAGAIRGFTSLMPTFENAEPVLYCYEIHLLPELRRTGLGARLMGYVVAAADNIPGLEKTVLTCFGSNDVALAFYEHLGFVTDDYSPRERRLRGGKVIRPDYLILSRRTQQNRPGAAARQGLSED